VTITADLLAITVDNEVQSEEIVSELERAGLSVQRGAIRTRGAAAAIDVLVALGSAGVLTIVYQCLTVWCARHEDRELTLEFKGRKITMKGHSPPEQMDVLRQLAPEFLESASEGSQRPGTLPAKRR
jgi:hypothetical protein